MSDPKIAPTDALLKRITAPVKASLADIPADASYDVVVIGAGGAGLSAALTAAIEGARVLVVERTEYLGGTTALSAATTWIPVNSHCADVGTQDSVEKAEGFLARAVGERSPAALRSAFVRNGAAAVDYIERQSQVKYRARPFHPDYLSELEGSTLRGRAIEPKPFDGRLLGDWFSLIRPPIPEFTVLGGMMVDRDDIANLLKLTKDWNAFRYSLGIIARHAKDRLGHARGTRLVMGNALIARQLYSLLERGVQFCVSTRLERLIVDEAASACNEGGVTVGSVTGVVLSAGGVTRSLRVTGGVVLASGGFNRHPKKRAERLPGIAQEWCPGAPGHTGEAHDLALAAGARYGTGGLSDCFWAPVSLRKRADGSTAAFPHFLLDRGKPGFVTVDQRGRRFVNENTSYHLFGIAMQEANKTSPAIPAWLVTDSAGIARYGMGMVRPGGKGFAPFIAEGYLIEAQTLAELAQKLGIDARTLEATIAQMNEAAASGVDPLFARGTTDYQRANGDATRTELANCCLGPIGQGPFYAVRLYPGDIGAATGFVTDANARVLGAGERPIGGLYAVGNDQQSVMGGVYPAPGITIGPGMVFGWLAARDAVARSKGGRAVAREPSEALG
ncbi:FAD-dependent oxidoreductase [Derxia gummosa]|uniref:FAD-dependent oxidoreductase n=1 Tax=Derxia gummosa DSM 723 TaxID=1121388 RepID=A0A8B6XAY7_9BURK|nr:FAD-dependent oxidoreductase [Derxia gummosa]